MDVDFFLKLRTKFIWRLLRRRGEGLSRNANAELNAEGRRSMILRLMKAARRACFANACGNDWTQCPADADLIEQIVLAGNTSPHGRHRWPSNVRKICARGFQTHIYRGVREER